MSFKIEFKEQAREDIAIIVQWYDEQRDGLGDSFLTELRQFIDQLSFNPHIYQVRRKNTRLGILKRFPYIIAYQIENKSIIIFSIIHQHQHPQKKFQRIKKK